ncbi:uncharacterized protein ALTATR162_LOCUS2622 [Alternaria atra]|uniref:Uncharacterized protein n=1 Tax=Alternaria atra TaxID=119953 RepID=A0A8J2HYG1_9PLEO|nr:uncharacterized protein ALTATR162_LOCUS2622 [Alternaria atra]CAG5150311.1 unnamed protein product [Alternaria atra]
MFYDTGLLGQRLVCLLWNKEVYLPLAQTEACHSSALSMKCSGYDIQTLITSRKPTKDAELKGLNDYPEDLTGLTFRLTHQNTRGYRYRNIQVKA